MFGITYIREFASDKHIYVNWLIIGHGRAYSPINIYTLIGRFVDDTDKLILRFLRDRDVPGDRPMSRRAALEFMRSMSSGERQKWRSMASSHYGHGKAGPYRDVKSVTPALPAKVVPRPVVTPPKASAPVVSASPAPQAPRPSGRPSLPAKQRKKLVSVYLDRLQIEALDNLARITGTTAAHHIREALTRYLKSEAPGTGQLSPDDRSQSSDDS